MPLAQEPSAESVRTHFVSILKSIEPDRPLICNCTPKCENGKCQNPKADRDLGEIARGFSWPEEEFIKALESPDPSPKNLIHKCNLNAWVPGQFKGRRKKEDLIGRSIVGLDFDACVFDDVVETFDKMGLKAAIHTTPSHPNPDGSDRVRVYVFLKRPVNAREWDDKIKPWMKGFEEQDENALDVTRFFYAPVRTEKYRYLALEGIYLDPDALPTLTHADAPAPAPSATRLRAAPNELSAAELLGRNWPSKGRHRAQLALAGMLIRDGMGREQAIEFLCEVCRIAGNEEREKRVQTVDDTIRKYRDGKAYSGFTELSQLIDSEIVRLASKRLMGTDEQREAFEKWPEKGANGSNEERGFKTGDHVELARNLLRQSGQIAFTEGAFYAYVPERGIWDAEGVEKAMRIRVQEMSGVCFGKDQVVRIRAGDVNGVLELARGHVEDCDFFEGASPGLACQDSFVQLSDDGEVRLLAHSPEHHARMHYPFRFDPQARAPLFERALNDWFRDDEDREEKISCLQEFFGACLFGIATRYQKCIVAPGEGSNGKSTLIEIVKAAFSSNNVSAFSPPALLSDRKRAELVGKVLNIVAEISAKNMQETQFFKQIIAGDAVDAEPKFKNPFSFRPIAGHFFAANKLPDSSDQTLGFWRRFLVIKFNRNFENDPTKDPKLAAKIVREERQGLLAWMVAGASRLVFNGKYTEPQSSQAALLGWRLTSDSVGVFLSEATEQSAIEKGIGAARLYRLYNAWAKANAYQPTSSKEFASRLGLRKVESKRTKKGVLYALGLTENFREDHKHIVLAAS